MSKFLNDIVLDQALNYIKSNANLVLLCSDQPTDFTDALNNYPTGKLLGQGVVDATDFTVQNGVSQGRRVTMSTQVGVAITTSGTVTHIALVDTVNQTLLAVTTITSQAVSASETAQLNATDWTLNDVV